MFKNFLKFLNRERTQVIAVIVAGSLLVTGLCCESQVQSLQVPDKLVNRDQLQAEVDFFLATAANRFKQLDREDEWKAIAFNWMALWLETGQFNPNGLIALVMGVLGVGAITDNVRKRLEIKKLNHAGQDN